MPQTAVTPAELELVIGLYDFATFERLPHSEGDALFLQSVNMPAVADGVPNQTAVNFEDEIVQEIETQIVLRRPGNSDQAEGPRRRFPVILDIRIPGFQFDFTEEDIEAKKPLAMIRT